MKPTSLRAAAGRSPARWQLPVVATLTLSVALAGCEPPRRAVAAAVELGVPFDALVDLDEVAAASRWDRGTVAVDVVWYRDGAWTVSTITSGAALQDRNAARLRSYAGTGDAWNTFVYGTAAPGAQWVRLKGFPRRRGGQVTNDGTWLVVLPGEDVGPHDRRVEFLDADGEVLYAADGIFPPDA